MKDTQIFLSCEHAVNVIPPAFKDCFKKDKAVLKTHKAIDIGALELATHLSQQLNCSLISANVSRLIIDCNRSLHHRQCFSSYTKHLPQETKQQIIETYYHPYRQAVENAIDHLIKQNIQVLHISVHSFTPIMNGIKRNAAIGLLYASNRSAETEVARVWRKFLNQQAPAFRVRANYPYRGMSDGFTTFLRKKYHQDQYLGIELELNQVLMNHPNDIEQITKEITASLIAVQQFF